MPLRVGGGGKEYGREAPSSTTHIHYRERVIEKLIPDHYLRVIN